MPTTAELESRQLMTAQRASANIATGNESFHPAGRGHETWVTASRTSDDRTLADWMALVLQSASSFNVMDPEYGAVGDGVTDDTAAIQAAITAMKAHIAAMEPTVTAKAALIFPPGHSFVVTGSIDLQFITAINWFIIGYGAVIFAKCTGKTVFDMLGSRRSTILGLTFRCDPSNAPAIGIQYCRQSAAGDSSVHTLRDVSFVGNTSRCFIYNMAAEVFYADNLRMNQGHASAEGAIVLDGNNHLGAITDFTDTTCPADTANSCTQFTFTNMFSGTDNADPVFKIYAASQIRVINSYGYSTGPMVHYVQNAGTVLRDAYFDMHFELGTHHLFVEGSGSITLIGMGFRDFAPTDSTAFIEADTGVTLTLTDLDLHTFAFAGTLFLGTIASYQGLINGKPTQTRKHLGYISGRFYSTYSGTYTEATAIAAVDTIYFRPFYLYGRATIKTLSVHLATAGAGSSVKMAIYSCSAGQRPLAPVVADNTGQDTTGSAGTITADVTDTVLDEGWYWFAIKTTGTPPALRSVPTTFTTSTEFMGHTVIGASAITGYISADAYANDFPTFAEGAAFSSSSTVVHPICILGV